MPQFTTTDAGIQCDKGTIPRTLSVTSQQFAEADEKLIATEADKNPGSNIPPFGVCSITQKSCMPAPTDWQNTSSFKVEQFCKLTTDSFCPCNIGGIIRFISSGHSGFYESE